MGTSRGPITLTGGSVPPGGGNTIVRVSQRVINIVSTRTQPTGLCAADTTWTGTDSSLLYTLKI